MFFSCTHSASVSIPFKNDYFQLSILLEVFPIMFSFRYISGLLIHTYRLQLFPPNYSLPLHSVIFLPTVKLFSFCLIPYVYHCHCFLCFWISSIKSQPKPRPSSLSHFCFFLNFEFYGTVP